MNALKIGVVGTGGIAVQRHIPAFKSMEMDKAVLTAVYDIEESRAQAVADAFSIEKVFSDYDRFLESVDAVVICTPNKFHAELTVQALNAGCHVLCEKPMALTIDEGEAMLEAAEKSGKHLSIGYHYRFMRESQAAKRLIKEGLIGEPIVSRFQALRRRKVPGWGVFTNKELQGGGSLMDYGCHLLDLTLWLLDFPKPVEVSAASYDKLSRLPELTNVWGEIDAETFNVDDHLTGYIRFENGATMQLETSWAANIPEDKESLSISGTSGGLDVFPLSLNQAKHGMLLDSTPYWLPGEDSIDLPQVRNFVNCCLGLEEPVVKAHEALETTRLIQYLYQSSQEGQAIKIERKG
jgi:predicted dehydrogenase